MWWGSGVDLSVVDIGSPVFRVNNRRTDKCSCWEHVDGGKERTRRLKNPGRPHVARGPQRACCKTEIPMGSVSSLDTSHSLA